MENEYIIQLYTMRNMEIPDFTGLSDEEIANQVGKMLKTTEAPSQSKLKNEARENIRKEKRAALEASRHHQTYSLTWKSWVAMRQRCYNPNHHAYSYYGGRGIKVCKRWMGLNGYKNFVADVGERTVYEHSIDRINNDGNYEPGNCRWATMKEQANNRRLPTRR